MNCTETQKLLQERFDDGLETAADAQAHVLACPSCQAYEQRLLALDEALWRLPSEAPEARLAQRIRARIEKESEPAIAFGPAGVAAAAAIAIVVALLGTRFPIPLDLRNWWGNVDLALPLWGWPEWGWPQWATLAFWQQIEWREWGANLLAHPPDPREGMAFIHAQLESAWALLASLIETGGRALTTPVANLPLAGPLLWASLAAIVGLLAAFNGFEAFSLRAAAGGSHEPEPRSPNKP